MTAMDANELRELGQQFRVDSIRPAAVAKSGHPTSGMSAADLMAVLVANHLRYDYDNPKSPANDRLIFSKGHASTLYYAILRAVGAITDEELLTYRKFGSMLEGHPTPLIPWVYVERARAFGWNAIEIDGHNVDEIDRTYKMASETAGRPTVIVARTIKGKGVKAVEDKDGWHGKPLDDPDAAIAELGGIRNIHVDVAKPEPAEPHEFPDRPLELPRYELGQEVATRKAYGEALAALGSARGDVVALDGEVSNSTFAEIFKQAHPDRFFEMYIAEQQLVAAAVGLHARGWNAFGSTFAAFFSRAYDFIRMAAISRVDLRLAGSHAGVSIGEDGPSQMALEDIASLRAIHSSVVLHPCDANQTAKLVVAMADTKGIVFMRTLRPNTPVIYGPDEEFEVGGSRVIRSSDDDDVTIIGAGITVHEALKAAEALEE